MDEIGRFKEQFEDFCLLCSDSWQLVFLWLRSKSWSGIKGKFKPPSKQKGHVDHGAYLYPLICQVNMQFSTDVVNIYNTYRKMGILKQWGDTMLGDLKRFYRAMRLKAADGNMNAEEPKKLHRYRHPRRRSKLRLKALLTAVSISYSRRLKATQC